MAATTPLDEFKSALENLDLEKIKQLKQNGFNILTDINFIENLDSKIGLNDGFKCNALIYLACIEHLLNKPDSIDKDIPNAFRNNPKTQLYTADKYAALINYFVAQGLNINDIDNQFKQSAFL